MTRVTFDRNAPPHLVSLCVELSIRRAIRILLRRRDIKFVAVLKLPNYDDSHLYEEAARRVIGVGTDYDDYGDDHALVCSSATLDRSSWHIMTKLERCRRALVLHDASKALADDVRLSADFESDVLQPTGADFEVASRLLGLPPLSKSDAAFLASQPLRSVRLAMLRSRPFSRIVARLSTSEMSAPEPSARKEEGRRDGYEDGPTLETLAGYGEAKTWGLQLAQDLADWKGGKIEWEDVDRGVLLHGPPGCGKTMYAGALARSCNVPLLTASAAEWQSKGHLGDMLKAMRLFFEKAVQKAPCIAFLDEVDSFGDRDAGADDRNGDYQRQVINALLECLAPADGRRGVVVVGATNNAQKLDAALLRPGRFERIIDIPMPDDDARLSIFRHHLFGYTHSFREAVFKVATRGWSGAQLEKLARDARRLCRRRGGKAVSDGDVFDAMPPYRPFTKDELFRLAVHEAGHVLLVLALQPTNLIGVRIAVGLQEGSRTIDLGTTAMKESMPIFGTQSALTDRIVILLGGMVAEKMIFREHSTTVGGHRSSDLAMVTRYATMMERHYGFGDILISEAKIDDDDLYRYRVDVKEASVSVNTRIKSCLKRAEDLLMDNREGLLRLAGHLIETPELGVDTIRKIVGTVVGFGIDKSMHGKAKVISQPSED